MAEKVNRRNFLAAASAGAAGAAAISLADVSVRATAAAASEPRPQAARPEAANVKALVFDTFGTVVDWRSSIIAEGTAWGKAKGLQVNWTEFTDKWRMGYGPSMDKVRGGELPWTRLDDLHRLILDQLLLEVQDHRG